MWLNPQSWAVISGLATPEQGDAALNNVYERLNTEYGAILMDPPYHCLLYTSKEMMSKAVSFKVALPCGFVSPVSKSRF